MGEGSAATPHPPRRADASPAEGATSPRPGSTVVCDTNCFGPSAPAMPVPRLVGRRAGRCGGCCCLLHSCCRKERLAPASCSPVGSGRASLWGAARCVPSSCPPSLPAAIPGPSAGGLPAPPRQSSAALKPLACSACTGSTVCLCWAGLADPAQAPAAQLADELSSSLSLANTTWKT